MPGHQSYSRFLSYGSFCSEQIFATIKPAAIASSRLGHFLDPETNGFPQTRTVVAALAGLIVFFIVGGFTIALASRVMLVVVTTVAVMIEVMVMALTAADLRQYRSCRYRRNVANTVLTVLFTIFIMTVLYGTTWYLAQNSWTLDISSDTLQTAPWPAVVIMQDVAAHFQANLIEQPWTCFIGQTQNAPTCSSMNASEVAALQVSSCNCSTSWQQRIQHGFIDNDTKRFVSFVPPSNLVSGSVQTFFNLRAAFNYNSSQWLSSGSIIGSPNLWVLVYDPAIPAQEAYTSGTAGLSLINGNGFTTVTLSPTYVRRKGVTPHYEYNAAMSTSPNLNVACDVAAGNTSAVSTQGMSSNASAYSLCYASIAFRFATMQRTTITERPVMSWADVVASVGSYFALVQFVCWVISGVAWTGTDSVSAREEIHL